MLLQRQCLRPGSDGRSAQLQGRIPLAWQSSLLSFTACVAPLKSSVHLKLEHDISKVVDVLMVRGWPDIVSPVEVAVTGKRISSECATFKLSFRHCLACNFHTLMHPSWKVGARL